MFSVWFCTVARSVYIYKVLDHLELNPLKNRGAVAMKLIEWLMAPRRYISSNDASNDRKYRLHFVDLMRIVLLRTLRLDSNDAQDQSGSSGSSSGPVRHELEELLSRIKQLVAEHRMLDHEQFDHIVHDEILWLSSKRQSQSKRTSKVQTESEAVSFIEMVLRIRPQCLFQMATFSDSLRDQSPLDLAKRCRLHKVAHFLQSAAAEAAANHLQPNPATDSFENVSSESSAADDPQDAAAPRDDAVDREREMFLNVVTPRNQKSKSLSINVNASRVNAKRDRNVMTLPVDYEHDKRRKRRSKSRPRTDPSSHPDADFVHQVKCGHAPLFFLLLYEMTTSHFAPTTVTAKWAISPWP